MATILWRENRIRPGTLFAARDHQAGPELSPTRLVRRKELSSPARTQARKDPPTGWAGVLLGILPFFVFGVIYLIQAASELGWLAGWPAGLIRIGPLIAYGLVSSGLILCWIMGFPRWSLAYLGMGLYFANFTSNAQIYGVRYGLQGWLPLLTGLIVGLLISRTFLPLGYLFSSIWKDWTRLSFGIYAYLLPLMTIIFFDGDWGGPEFFGLIFDTLLLAAGAVAYMRGRTIWRRAISLQVVMVIMLVRGLLMGDWFGGPDNLASIDLPGLGLVVLMWGGLMFVPGLIGLLRRGFGARNTVIR
jgi:hypothetical protein